MHFANICTYEKFLEIPICKNKSFIRYIGLKCFILSNNKHNLQKKIYLVFLKFQNVSLNYLENEVLMFFLKTLELLKIEKEVPDLQTLTKFTKEVAETAVR